VAKLAFDRDILTSAPDEPGVYRFLDAAGEVIYVGKAKRMKRRLAVYRRISLAARRKRHRIYIVWAARRSTNSDADIYLTLSIDGGNSFAAVDQFDPLCTTPPYCPCQTPPACPITLPGEDDFFPVVSVDTQLRPVWMDSRDGQQDIYTANVSGC
jgi:hypothetical protein